MSLSENLLIVSSLKSQLDQLRPLSPEMERRIMQKFRLDWNYNSSNIEGNTLTYGETKALILFGQTAQAKPLRDHLEMSGHDEAIKYIEEVVRQERPLTENFIRELHKLVLKEPYQVDAKTPDGKPTKRWISIGKYKTMPNHVETRTGEMFYFASPEETPAKMFDLLNWYIENRESEDVHPVVFATEFHYRFVRIHPFDDGNGRLARLLMNFILMQKGYPPAIIKTEEKQEYYNALQQADALQLEYFFDYVCQQVIHSLEIMIKGANGEDIEEPDDLDKKIQLLKTRLGEEAKSKVKINRSVESIYSVLENSITQLLNSLEIRLGDFDSLVKSKDFEIKVSPIYQEFKGKILNAVFEKLLDYFLKWKSELNSITIIYYYSGLIHFSNSDSNKGFKLEIFFHDFLYEIKGAGIQKPIHRRYDQNLTVQDIDKITLAVGNYLYENLEETLDEMEEE